MKKSFPTTGIPQYIDTKRTKKHSGKAQKNKVRQKRATELQRQQRHRETRKKPSIGTTKFGDIQNYT
jgi:hypothetical protein